MQRTDTWLLQLSGINFTHLSCFLINKKFLIDWNCMSSEITWGIRSPHHHWCADADKMNHYQHYSTFPLHPQIGAMSLLYIACVSFVGCIIFTGYCIEVTNSTPQKDIHQLNQELQKQGFKTLSSDNDFKSSLTCNSCGLTLSHQNSAKAMRLVKRHANCDSHKVKAGWYLSAENKVLASKP